MKKIKILSIIISFLLFLISGYKSPVLADHCIITTGNFYLYQKNLLDDNIHIPLLNLNNQSPAELINSQSLKDGKISAYISSTQTGCNREFSRWSSAYIFDESIRPTGKESYCTDGENDPEDNRGYGCAYDRRWRQTGDRGDFEPDPTRNIDVTNPASVDFILTGNSGVYFVDGVAYANSRVQGEPDHWYWWWDPRLFLFERIIHRDRITGEWVNNLIIDPVSQRLTGTIVVPWYEGVMLANGLNPNYYLLINTDPDTTIDTNPNRQNEEAQIYPLSGGIFRGSPIWTQDNNFNLSVGNLVPATRYYWRIRQQGERYTTYIPGNTFITPASPPGLDTRNITVTDNNNISISIPVSFESGDHSLNQRVWARYSTTSPQSCNDTFGTEVDITGITHTGSSYGGTLQINNLPPAANYYACLFITNAGGSAQSYHTFQIPLAVTISATPDTISSGLTATVTYNIYGIQPDACYFSQSPLHVFTEGWQNPLRNEITVGSHTRTVTLTNTDETAPAPVRLEILCTKGVHGPDYQQVEQGTTVTVGRSRFEARNGTTSSVFVGSNVLGFKGNMGGVKGADASCQKIAIDRGVNGVWKAWLSSRDSNARDRLNPTGTENRYELLSNQTKIADSWTDLTDGSIDTNINKGITGGDVTGNPVFTATNPDGTYNNSRDNPSNIADCKNWTYVEFQERPAMHYSTVGHTSYPLPGNQGGQQWTKWGSDDTQLRNDGLSTPQSCDEIKPIYCFEKLASAMPAPSCETSSMMLTFNPASPAVGQEVIPVASINTCTNKTIIFKQGSCSSGTALNISCTASGTGCSGTAFLAPAANTTYSACMDKNNDNDFADEGESAPAILTVRPAATPPPPATPPVATNCGSSNRATGLVSTPKIESGSNFGTTGGCAIDPNTTFAPYKIPTFDDLKSLYYTQR